MMNTPAEILDDAYSYLIVINWGVGATVLFNLLANLLRALGDSRTPLLFLVVASILNIVLDLLFILVFKMGVAGAGLATVVSRLFSCLLCLLYIHKRFRFCNSRMLIGPSIGHLYAGICGSVSRWASKPPSLQSVPSFFRLRLTDLGQQP